VRSSSWPPTLCSIWQILLRSFLDDFESDIDVCNVNNVHSDHRDPVIIHLCCLCDFSLLRYKEDDQLAACSFRWCAAIFFIRSPSVLHLVYLCGHIASNMGASICERSVLSFSIRVLILHRKRTFHSVTWSVNDSHFVNYGMIFVVYKSNYNLKTNRQNWINVLLG